MLAALEVLRQLHYYLQEQSKAYYRWWRNTLESEEAVLSKINPNVRYRLGRLLRFLFFAWVFGAIIASFISEPGNEVGAIEAWFRLPGIIKEQLEHHLLRVHHLVRHPAVRRDFWFMSRGGTEVCAGRHRHAVLRRQVRTPCSIG